MTRIWRYVLNHDNGMAPCVENGMLSLTCCKPIIRRGAENGDWVIGFVTQRVSSGQTLVSWAGKVAESPMLGEYEKRYRGRSDAIYKLAGIGLDGREELVRVREDDYHRGLEGRDFSGRKALVFEPFWYWGNSSNIVAPDYIADLAHPFVGQTHKNSSPERALALEKWLFSLSKAGACGQPRDKI